MADDGPAREAILKECEAAQRDGRKAIDQMQRQLRELRLLVRQIETELQQLAPRRIEREDQVRLIEASPNSFSPADVREAYAALVEVNNKQFLLQVQLDSLRQREQTLILQSGQLERVIGLLGRLGLAFPVHAAATAAPSTFGRAEPESPRETARQLVAAREAQSRLLSQQVLDGPVQALSNLILQAEVSLRLLGRDRERAAVEMRGLKDSLAAALGDVRRFAADLCPPALAEVGLRATIRRYLEEIETRSGVSTRLTASGQELRLAPELELHLFRLLQEALRYAFRRSRPSEVDVTLEVAGDSVALIVAASYEAAGWMPAQPEELQTLDYYARACDGEVRVEHPGETSVAIAVSVPLQSPN